MIEGKDDVRLVGAIEAGGTKILCGIGTSRKSLATVRIPTVDPAATVDAMITFFEAAAAEYGALHALGIGSFGPISLDPKSDDYGRILNTPKAGWSGVDLPHLLGGALDLPVAINTDVNAAALAEARHSPPPGFDPFVYVTVGTGIGVGIAYGESAGWALGQSEAGHLRVRRHPDHAAFPGVCPYHGDCLEGLASGPAISAFWGQSLDRFPVEHPSFAMQAWYVAQLCSALMLMIAPHRIVLGGGVMENRALLGPVKREILSSTNDYGAHLYGGERIDRMIKHSSLPEPPGLVGAYLLAEGLLRPSLARGAS